MREAQCTSLEETNWNPSLERESGKCSSQSRAKKGKEGRGSVCSGQHTTHLHVVSVGEGKGGWIQAGRVVSTEN